jgi:H+-transporting ATPase
MRLVLGVSTVLGVFGVIAAFGLFYLAERVFHLDRAHIQTLMYLKLSVAGHLTIFLTRTRGPFWSIRPARILWMAVFGTQAVATCIAIFGLGLVTPLGWNWALLVWGYALAWALVNDRIKLLTYRVLDIAKVEPQVDRPSNAQPQSGSETAAASDSEAKAKNEPKPNAKSDVKSETNPKAKAMTKPHAKHDAAPDAKPAPQSDADSETTSEAKTETKPDAKPETAPTPDAKSALETLLNTSLGDLLLAGLLKDPEDAGRVIAAALSQAKAGIIAPKPPETDAAPEAQPEGKTEHLAQPEGKAEPAAKSEVQADAKPKAPADATPQAAE